MKKCGKWEYNMDTACVEMKQPDGTMIAIDTLAVEREFMETWLDRREAELNRTQPQRIPLIPAKAPVR